MKTFTCLLVALLLLSACSDYDHDVPDTDANRAGFERLFGFAPPADVTDLYYFVDELGADVLHQLGFAAKPETVNQIVTTLDLPPADMADCHGLGLAYAFPWWDEDDIRQATFYQKANAQRDYWRALWYSEATGRVYYLEYSL